MKYAAFALLAPLLAAGCTATTPPDILPLANPADPMIGVRQSHYHPVAANYQHRTPVTPENWRQLNEQLSPANSGAGS